jgi:hypothetical protein
MAIQSKGILQFIPQILAMLSLVAGGGFFYGRVDNAFTEIKNSKDRQDRQFELIQKLEGRIIELEKRTEFYRGLREGRNEAAGRKSTE